MKILFLCNKSPWPPKEGGPMAMNMLIEGLADAGNEVKVLAVNSFKYNISENQIPPGYRQKTSIGLIDLDLRVRPVPAFLNLFTGRSYHVERFISKKFDDRIKEMLSEHEFDIIQLETLFMAPYIATIRRYSGAKIILRAHNIEHMIWERVASETKNPLKRWYIRHLAVTLKRYEEQMTGAFDAIVAITKNDAGYFRNLLNSKVVGRLPLAIGRNMATGRAHPPTIPVIDIPYGIRVAGIPGEREPGEVPSLFSIGSMNWIPNQEGIRWFIDHVWPDVHRQFPRLKYYLAGREMPAWMLRLDQPNVIVLGEVADAAEFMADKTIMIVPLFSGSGIRIKIIEGMAAAKTIISTTTGAEGIGCTDRDNILIANLPCEFFEMISVCVNDPELCAKIGKQARKMISTDYDPACLIKKLTAFYLELLK